MKIINAFMVIAMGLLLGVSQVEAAPSNEQVEANTQLESLLTSLGKIELTVERYELGRLLILQKQIEKVRATIQARGLAHMATIREYQILIVNFRYSTAYLSRVSTDSTSGEIASMLKTLDVIVEQRGFDDSPYTQITLGVFTQLSKLLGELMNAPVSPLLKSQMSALIPSIGQVMAVATQGDRPRTFAAAQPLTKQIQSLYPLFLQVSSNDQGFETILNIQGLVEFYAEFAQIEK